jgi:hypothetical protein
MATSLEMGTSAPGADGDGPGSALGADARPDPSRVQPYQHMANQDRGTGGESTADFLGYFSIGLGLAEFLAPHAMNKVIGVKHPDDRSLSTMRAMGLREIGHGLAILTNQHPETRSTWRCSARRSRIRRTTAGGPRSPPSTSSR